MAVMRFRIQDQTVALLMAAFMMAGHAAAYAATRHEACASTRHHCAKIAVVLTCCCGHTADTNGMRGVAQTRVGLSSDAALSWTPPQCAGDASPFLPPAGDRAAPTRDRPPDLPTLFADLRL